MDLEVVSWIPLASFSREAGWETHLGATEGLAADNNDIVIWQLVGNLLDEALGCLFHFGVKVHGEAVLLLQEVKAGPVRRWLWRGTRVPSGSS